MSCPEPSKLRRAYSRRHHGTSSSSCVSPNLRHPQRRKRWEPDWFTAPSTSITWLLLGGKSSHLSLSLLKRLFAGTIVRSSIRRIRVSDEKGTVPRYVEELLVNLLPRLEKSQGVRMNFYEHPHKALLNTHCRCSPGFRLDLRKTASPPVYNDFHVLTRMHLMLLS